MVAGYFRGWVEVCIMRLMDIILAVPSLLLALVIVAILGPGLENAMIAVAVVYSPHFVRLTRASAIAELSKDYVTASRIAGAGLPRLMFATVLPNCMAPLIVQGTYICASAILIEAFLSFLGAGVSTEIPTWGNIMAEGRTYFQIKPGLIFWPGLLLSLCILSINLLGDTARDLLDPRMKKREG